MDFSLSFYCFFYSYFISILFVFLCCRLATFTTHWSNNNSMRKLFKHRTSIMDMNHWIIHSIASPSIYPLFPLFSPIIQTYRVYFLLLLHWNLMSTIFWCSPFIESITKYEVFISTCHSFLDVIKHFINFMSNWLKFPERRFEKKKKKND